jgi:hypothetical protein
LSRNKKKVLLLWYEIDTRPELLRPFAEISDEIEFIQLVYRTREERTGSSSPFRMIFWFDYLSPEQLINDIRPDIVLGNTQDLLSISLLRTCRKKKIPVYFLQHGFAVDNPSAALPKLKRQIAVAGSTVAKYLRIFFFYFSSFSFYRVKEWIQGLRLFFAFSVKNPTEALEKNWYAWWCPDACICFSEYAAVYYKRLYHEHSNFYYTGIICFDDFFRHVRETADQQTSSDYYLLIDTNFEEYKEAVTINEINRFYLNLSEYCRKRNARLKIKLHPWNYGYEGLLKHDNIDFYRNLDTAGLNELIIQARGCFGFYSSLSIPVAAVKPFAQVQYGDIYLSCLADNPSIAIIDFYHFKEQEFFTNHTTGTYLTEKEKSFLIFSDDGKATDRLHDILLK